MITKKNIRELIWYRFKDFGRVIFSQRMIYLPYPQIYSNKKNTFFLKDRSFMCM